ncbi:IucA/IucC family protein [Cohnella cholangitidis]|uniref:IucA/IucC family siderophore biosynthesis protein n=1 Tax=Cohnella cholangitidis TaxID=2598458 RepID=A0A7G5BZJ4_9BACL|nr:IucA/IucC family protein [Cohnella cholangitidis]QMV42378.1 IucA/IucC family siderophore biosynthesis protein [Cohnella cholangitidis]
MQRTSSLSERRLTAFEEVTDRIMRQTMEALIFEGIVEVAKEGRKWSFAGKTAAGDVADYSCEAEEKWSFGRVKIVRNSIRREGEPYANLYLFLEEVIQNRLEGAHTASFIHELLETLAKDHQSRELLPDRIPEQDRHYEALESHMTDGHPYHPSYKSRIGFSLADNYAYGPEFNQEVLLYWVAVNEQLADFALSSENSLEDIHKHHLTDRDRRKFNRIVKEKGCGDKKYAIIPVHPWQWEHLLPSVFVQQLKDQDIVLLGTSDRPYRAQQSIRTLAHRDNTDATYIKLAMSITNTSTSRILAHHTTQNAPLISDWLDTIVRNDSLLQKERFRLLREVMGISFRYDKLPPIQYRSAYGTLGAIYRENVSTYLEEGEEAWPLNALLLTQKNGESFIQAAIRQHGVEKWSDALIRTVTLPIIHLLYAHGIALESHAQNIILVVQDRLPSRIIVKDLHDGVRYVPDKLLRPEWAPKLNPEPETHRKFNRYSFIQTESVSEVRDYTFDAFFFICMTDICWALERFGLSEKDFWRKCAGTIVSYQKEHPEYVDRFEMFDLFAEDALIEEMTKRRIYGDSELYFRSAKNPLLLARAELE